MKVRMLKIAAGPEWSGRPGQVVEVKDDVARLLVKGGYAVFVDPPKAIKPEEVREKAIPAIKIETRKKKGSAKK